MKAIVKVRGEPGLDLKEVSLPEVTSHRVLIKVKACSICGSDVHLYKWDAWARANLIPPRVIGHEGAGEVVEVGAQVEHIRAGDHVSFESHLPCLGCARCRTGERHLCTRLKTIGFGVDGCFAEYISLPEICCVKNDASLPWEIASVQEPLGNSVYAVMESRVGGKSVAVFGDGPTGLFAVAVAKALGASPIFAVGASPYRLKIMEKLRPDYLVDATRENVRDFILGKTGGEGTDVVIEMSGNEKAIHDGFKVVRNGGAYTAFGIPANPLPVDFASEIILKGIQIKAIHGRKMFETWEEMGKLLTSGRLDIRPVITHRFPLNQFEEAMGLLTQNPIQAGKIILNP